MANLETFGLSFMSLLSGLELSFINNKNEQIILAFYEGQINTVKTINNNGRVIKKYAPCAIKLQDFIFLVSSVDESENENIKSFLDLAQKSINKIKI